MKSPIHTLIEISTYILTSHPALIPQLEDAITRMRGGRQVKSFVPNGHYYSPVVDPECVRHLFPNHGTDVRLGGVELNLKTGMGLHG
jgi:hypothetical protein